jgi:poly-gamma-glutamate synthesis protein (capsule biosynthesis protein)
VAIGLLGDVMLGRMVAEELGSRPPESLWAPELRDLAAGLDLVVANLECCVSSGGAPTTAIEGKPFFFRAPPRALGALAATNVRAVSLANNHALDFGADALSDTLELLDAAGIETVGAGFGLEAARRPAIVRAAGSQITVIAATDHPVEYAAARDRWGVALADLHDGPPDWLLSEVSSARSRGDLVIVFPHWGPNMTIAPSARQRRAAVALAEAGANLIAGHSAHVFHGVGWAAGPVVFDLGDALDDYRVDPELRNDLGVLAIWRPFEDGQELELVGLLLEYCYTRLAEGADADWIAERLTRACDELDTRVTRVAEQRFVVEPKLPHGPPSGG